MPNGDLQGSTASDGGGLLSFGSTASLPTSLLTFSSSSSAMVLVAGRGTTFSRTRYITPLACALLRIAIQNKILKKNDSFFRIHNEDGLHLEEGLRQRRERGAVGDGSEVLTWTAAGVLRPLRRQLQLQGDVGDCRAGEKASRGRQVINC